MVAERDAGFRFDNSFVRDLDGLYEPWQAVRASTPELLALNQSLAASLGVEPEWLRSSEGVDVLVGNTVPGGAEPVAQAYAGHQFGGYSPRLGDGRALLLGEVVGGTGERRDLHLKGSGRTPFARGGDGLATIGPMLREYVMCESMHALGIPTTRALAVVATGDPVRRESMLPGAVFVRVASSHLRVGTFQYAAGLDDPTAVVRLLHHALVRHHPDLIEAESPALAFLEAMVDSHASLIASWMNIGFVHGVMNTDNSTISGETIDYGPCAFMESYDPATVFSSIDHGGRYAYANQPGIAQWNLARLAEALLPLIDDDTDAAIGAATELLGTFPARYEARRSVGMASKLGLGSMPIDDAALGDDLLVLMKAASADFTSVWRSLSDVARGDSARFRTWFSNVDDGDVGGWLDRLAVAHAASGESADVIAARMESANPVYIARNHLVEEALAAAVGGDLDPFGELLAVVTDPFVERSESQRFAEPAPVGFTDGYQTFCGT